MRYASKHWPWKSRTILTWFCFASLFAAGASPAGFGADDALWETMGVATAAREANLRADVAGSVRKVLVEEGERVAAGQALLVLDDRVAQAELQRARASEESFRLAQRRAELELELMEARYQNMLAAHRAGAGTDVELLELRIRREQAIATLAEMRAKWEESSQAVALAAAQLDTHTVRAPFAGRVLRLRARLGERPDAETPLATVIDDAELRIELHAPAASYRALRVGQSYRMEFGEPVNREFTAALRYVQPSIEAASRTVRCVFAIENPGRRIPVGAAVKWRPPTNAGDSRDAAFTTSLESR